MFNVKVLLSTILAASLQGGLAGPCFADEVADLNEMYGTMVFIEAQLLDDRREAEQALAVPDGVLIEQPDGSIIALPRDDARNSVGMAFDIAQYMDLQNALRPFLSDEVNGILEMGISSGFGRVEAVNRTMDRVLADQARLRDALQRRIAASDHLLDVVRDVATDVLRERDERIAARDAAGVIDGSPCFDGSPPDGEATVAAIGYGGGAYPVHGPFICTSWSGYLWDSGTTIREFRCADRNARPPVCTLFSEMAYTVDQHPETGHTIYHLDDARTSITFHFK